MLLVEAVFEAGVLRPVSPLALPEGARVRIGVISFADVRAEWLARSEECLRRTWHDSADDIYNELLTLPPSRAPGSTENR